MNKIIKQTERFINFLDNNIVCIWVVSFIFFLAEKIFGNK